ncbi:uncharacterized protein [Nicotiana sylvestris]|uniref:uncharacterized protein n=1 Tax=Nicotiana sylvestris TaxID=4096 RepID=UPI00388C66DA
MAKKSRTRGRGQEGSVNQQGNMARKSVPQSEDAKKTKSLNVIQGIIPLELKQTPMVGLSIMVTPMKNNKLTTSVGTINQKHAQSSGKNSWADHVENEAKSQSESVRFHSVEGRTKAIEGGTQTFDRKPVVVKPWTWKPGMEMSKIMVEQVPIWTWLVGLDLKYWGQAALAKIAGLVGKPIKADTATKGKDKLMYARVMVEMPMNKTYPDAILFENELGQIIEQTVEYEWKPTLCDHRRNYGHIKEHCRKLQTNT